MARRPRLAILGTAPAIAQIQVAAERLRWRLTSAESSADLVYVVSGYSGDLEELAGSGADLALDVDLVAELGAATVDSLAATASGKLRRGEPLASAPAVSRWLRTIRETVGITHLSGLSRSPSLNPSMIAVALYAARMAGWAAAPDITSPEPGRLSLRFVTPVGDRRLDLDLAGGEELPQWELQAASPDSVARVALLPEPRVETNGAETLVPAEHPAEAFGQESFLRGWWNAVEEGVPARHDHLFVAALCEAARQISG